MLGDRIAIMAHGRLHAIGNAVSLKDVYGAGYRISIITPPTHIAHVKRAVKTLVPGAKLEDDSAGALMFEFAGDSVGRIPDLIRVLETESASLGVQAWGISQTTLEEVFLNVIREANPGGYSGV